MKYWFLCVCTCLLEVLPFVCSAQIGLVQTGMASYYAGRFNGRETASGEKFNSQEFTAAHPSLEFNTMLRVTNNTNGRSVLVRVNDRGPFANDRLIDLSKAAARQIGILGAGAAPVSIEVLGVNSQPTAREEAKASDQNRIQHPASGEPFAAGKTYSIWGTEKSPKGFGVQVASFTDILNARDTGKELIAAGISDVYIQVEQVGSAKVHRVLVGTFMKESEGQRIIHQLVEKDFEGFIKKHFLR